MAYYEDIAIVPNNCLKCILCNIFIEDNDHMIEIHVESRNHRELYMKRLMFRNGISITNKELFCEICTINVKIAKLTDHVESSHHQKNLLCIKNCIANDGEFLQIPDDSNFIHCVICNGQINFTTNAVESHIDSAKHWRAKAMVLQPLNGIFSVDDHDEYLWCKVCQIYFDNYVELIIQHVEDSEHAQNMHKILKLIDKQNITIRNYLQSLKEDKAFCKKCNTEVPFNVDNLQRHINGKKHYTQK